jgi:hypothetical protein
MAVKQIRNHGKKVWMARVAYHATGARRSATARKPRVRLRPTCSSS